MAQTSPINRASIGQAPISQAGALGLRVLLVEDDAMLSLMLENALETLGCTIYTATTVAEGARLAATVDAQIGLLDVNVAGQPVYPVAEMLRQRGIPFVFVTAYVRSSVAEEYGSVPCLHKPFHLAELEHLLRKTAAAPAR
jgi:DNA-binding response OmpR family regulator